MKQVTILLAAYKGNEWVGRQIESILAQDCDDWQLILSDDGEETAKTLEAYARRYPNKITHYRSGRRFGSAKAHFLHLLAQYQDSPYLMFADQDDVWHPDKVRLTLEAMQRAEEEERLREDWNREQMPVLVHTDLRVVDGELEEISPSFMDFSRLNGYRTGFRELLVQNQVTGCTVMINRPLARLAAKAKDTEPYLMHDHFLALLAAAFGKCVFLEEATMDYCQHGDNCVGAKNVRSLGYIREKIRSGQVKQAFAGAAAQAGAFAQAYGAEMEEEDLTAALALAEAPEKNKFARLWIYIRRGLIKHDFRRAVGQLLWW